jgi:hypothetical protein
VIITPEMQKTIDDLAEHGRDAINQSSFAHCLIVPDSKEGATMFAIAGDMLQPGHKDLTNRMLLCKLLEIRGYMVFVHDAWTSKVPASMRSSLPPSMADWPEHLRSERMVITVNKIGDVGRMFFHEYTRDAKGKPIWDKTKIEEVVGDFNAARFCYDLRPETFQKVAKIMHDGGGQDAAYDALMRSDVPRKVVDGAFDNAYFDDGIVNRKRVN